MPKKQQTPQNTDEVLKQAMGKSGGTANLHMHYTNGLEVDIKNYLATGKSDEKVNNVDWHYKFYTWSILKILGPGYYVEHFAAKYLGDIPPRSENSTTDWKRISKSAIARGMLTKDIDKKVASALQVKDAVSHYGIINPSSIAVYNDKEFKSLVNMYRTFFLCGVFGAASKNFKKIIEYYDLVYDNLNMVEKHLKRAYRS